MNENESFEKILGSQFKDATQTPPPEVWEAIEKRLPVPDAAPSPKPAHRGRLVAVVASAAAVVVAAVISISVMRTKPEPALAKQQGVAIEPVIVEDSVAVGEAPVPTVVSARENKSNTVADAVLVPSEMKVQAQPQDESRTKQVQAPAASASQPVAEEIAQVAPADIEPVVAPSLPSEKGRAEEAPSLSEKQVQADTAERKPVEVTIVVPNLLSPNGDGYNDCWVIPGLEEYGTVQVQIYTAKSKRIYMSHNYHNEFCGDDCPDGNYFYVLNFREIGVSRRGVLVIKR